MSEDTPVIEPNHPSDAMLKVINPLIRLLLRSPLGRRMNAQMLVLTFTGRKSGRRFELPLTAHRSGGELYVLTGARWQHNFHGGRDADVRLDGHVTPVRGVLVEDPQQVAEVYARRIAELGIKQASRQIGIKVNVPQPPTAEQILGLVPVQHLAAIRLGARA